MSQSQDLRAYQKQAIAELKEAYRAGKRRPVLVLPTGGGKTRIAVELARGALAKGGHVLAMAHRTELIDQMANRLRAEGIERVGIIAADRPTTNAPAQVASLQTLAARAGRGLPSAEVLIFDECHHGPAASWAEVAKGIRTRAGGDPAVIGLTATPSRSDGRGLGEVFDALVQISSVRELQELGVLVPMITRRPKAPTKTLAAEPVAAYLADAPGERGFVFVQNVAQAEALTLAFIAQGVQAATIHAETPWMLRSARIKAFQLQDPRPLHEAGYLEKPPLVLVNVYTLTEGVDVPEASYCLLARGCGHPGMLLQMAGRVGRAAPGKTSATLRDLRGVTHKLGLWERDRVWSLEGKACSLAQEEREREKKSQTCPACDGAFESYGVDREGWRVCPLCRQRLAAPAPIEVEHREHQDAGGGASEAAKRAALLAFVRASARRAGNRRGWVAWRFRERFGAWPPFGASDRVFAELGIDPKGPPPAPRDPAPEDEHGDAWEGDAA